MTPITMVGVVGYWGIIVHIEFSVKEVPGVRPEELWEGFEGFEGFD